MNREALHKSFRSLETELMNDDPDMEHILYQIFDISFQHGLHFSLEYDPTSPVSEVGGLEYGPYLPTFNWERYWSYSTLKDALAGTVSFVLENIDKIEVRV